jgi:hypothetical protein
MNKIKFCKKCKKNKKLINFVSSKNTIDGFENRCKECRSKYDKFYREKNMLKISVRQLAARQKRKIKQPWLFHLHSIKTRCDNLKHPTSKYYGHRGIRCLLSKNDIKELWIRDKAWVLERPSIDRFDSKSDYTISNCRFIELRENVKKAHIEKFIRRMNGSILAIPFVGDTSEINEKANLKLTDAII